MLKLQLCDSMVWDKYFFLRSAFLIALLTLALIACNSGTSQPQSIGEKVYRAKCTRCHGLDGKKGKKGAKDLNISTVSLEYRVNQIREGKDKMPSFSNRLSPEQIMAVAQYTMEKFGPASDTTSVK